MTESEIEEHFFRIIRLTTKRRWSRVAMYSLLTIGSIVSFFAPSQVLLTQTSPTITAIWSLGFALASLACLLGSLLDRIVYEYVMLPMLSSTLIVFGLAMVGQASLHDKLLLVPYVCLFWAFAIKLFIRWRDVHALVEAAELLPENGDGA